MLFPLWPGHLLLSGAPSNCLSPPLEHIGHPVTWGGMLILGHHIFLFFTLSMGFSRQEYRKVLVTLLCPTPLRPHEL